MEVFAVVTGVFGLLFGAYGAWRSWRTDRRQRLLGKKWEVELIDGEITMLFFNRMPRTVYGLTITPPDGYTLAPQYMPETLGPNEAARGVVLSRWRAVPKPFTITWHHRQDLTDEQRSFLLHFPAGYGR